MKICHWTKKDKIYNTSRPGIASIAWCFDKTFYSTESLYEIKTDFAFILGDNKTMQFLRKHGKSPKWNKMIFIQCQGIWQNSIGNYAEALTEIKFDAYMLFCKRHIPYFNIYGKPVFTFHLPYYPIVDNKGKNDTVFLNIKKDAQLTNYAGIFAVINKLPSSISFITTVNTAYRRDFEFFKGLINKYGLSKRITIFQPVPEKEYLAKMAECKVFLNMDYNQCIGRGIVDAHATNCQAVGTYTDMQELLFPEYEILPGEINQAAENVLKAINKQECKNKRPKKLTDEYFINKLKDDLCRIF